MDNKQLYSDLQDFRSDEPVLWALLVGKRTTITIAEHLIMLPGLVQARINEYLSEGVITEGSYMGNKVYKVIDPNYKAINEFAWKFRLKVTGKQPPQKKKKA